MATHEHRRVNSLGKGWPLLKGVMLGLRCQRSFLSFPITYPEDGPAVSSLGTTHLHLFGFLKQKTEEP